jgi:phage terminase large subunit GpA-like protein
MRTIGTLAELPDLGAFLAAVQFTFPCPHCGYEFHETFGWFERNDQVACGNCKDTIVFDAKEFRSAQGEFRAALERLWQSVSYLA